MKPFLRWAGSKHKLLPQIIPHIPHRYGRYYEPFLGAGALFFALAPRRATLSDVSSELIATWQSVRDSADWICSYLEDKIPDRELYYLIRENRSEEILERAGEFLYLNKTCWNGLYRVNSSGKFNVPFGAPKSNFIYDERNLRDCSKALGGSSISVRNCDFSTAARTVRSRDLVFFDPPYVTRHNMNGFRDYNEVLFSWEDQIRLAKTARKLAERGANVFVTNADHDEVRNLYPNFSYVKLTRSSTLASDAKKRGVASEALFFHRSSSS